ncbi:hypothetical protein D050_2649B, partial [Vibrio parahaemolyticus VPCR-2009]
TSCTRKDSNYDWWAIR